MKCYNSPLVFWIIKDTMNDVFNTLRNLELMQFEGFGPVTILRQVAENLNCGVQYGLCNQSLLAQAVRDALRKLCHGKRFNLVEFVVDHSGMEIALMCDALPPFLAVVKAMRENERTAMMIKCPVPPVVKRVKPFWVVPDVNTHRWNTMMD